MKHSKTGKIGTINKKTLIAALNIGKKVHYGYFRAPSGKDFQPFAFHNTRNGFDKFWERLCDFKEKCHTKTKL